MGKKKQNKKKRLYIWLTVLDMEQRNHQAQIEYQLP